MAKRNRNKGEWSAKHFIENLRLNNTIPIKTESELRCSGRLSSLFSTSDTRSITVNKIRLVSHETGKDRMWLRQTGHIRGHFKYFLFIQLNDAHEERTGSDYNKRTKFRGHLDITNSNLSFSLELNDPHN